MIYIGTLNSAGSDCVNNSTTSAPFTIPSNTVALRLQPSAATMLASVKLVTDAAFLPAATDMLQLGGVNSVNDLPIPGRPGGTPTAPIGLPTLAIRKTDAGAGTCKVFAIAV